MTRFVQTIAPLLVLLTSACAEVPTSNPDPLTKPSLLLLSETRCTATRVTLVLSCSSHDLSTPLSSVRAQRVTVGGQHRFVRLTNGTPSFSGDTMSFAVSVQNLLQQPLGTVDSTTSHADGVQVFFASLSGTGGIQEVNVANADGLGNFTGVGQAFFRYAGQALGADGILFPGETSASKKWQIDLGDNSSISFTVYVTAEVPNEDGSYLRFTQVTLGNGHACGLTTSGAYCWGSGLNGELGNSHLSSTIPIPVDQSVSGSFTQLSAGTGYTCGIASSGAYCWGSGSAGKLGTGNEISVNVPKPVIQTLSGTFTQISASGHLTCGISSTGAYCWGNGGRGALGGGSGVLTSNVPVAVDQSVSGRFTQVSAGADHACGITASGAYCWGEGDVGRLGNGGAADSSIPVAVVQSTSGTFTEVSAGGAHTCGVSSTGAYCWGQGTNGRLGNNSTTNRTVPVAVVQTSTGTFLHVTAGNAHTCGISASGTYCWGLNGNGQLGTGALAASTIPAAVDQSMSGAFTQIEGGFTHTCGITTTGAYCWGNGANGRLGTGRLQQELAPVPVAGSRGL